MLLYKGCDLHLLYYKDFFVTHGVKGTNISDWNWIDMSSSIAVMRLVDVKQMWSFVITFYHNVSKQQHGMKRGVSRDTATTITSMNIDIAPQKMY